MKKHSGFTLLEILIYVVIGGITLAIASFSFIRINRIATNFIVNSELNQNGKAILDQIQNIVNDSNYIISPKQNAGSTNNLILIKDNIEIKIEQSGNNSNNITVSYSNNYKPSVKLNPNGILLSNDSQKKLSFEQITNKTNSENIGLSQNIKIKFTLVYNKPTFGGFEYQAEKMFENTIVMNQKTSSFNPILNTYPTGTNGVAYGLRKLAGLNTNPNQLSSAYNGPAIRVRRGDSTGATVYDNAEMDIGFTSKGELDQGALQNFVGYQNFLSYSEDITTAGGWSFSKDINNNDTISITADIPNTTAPDGSNTAERVSLSIGNSNKSITKNTNITTDSTYTESYYVKANNGYNFVQIATSTGFSNNTYQNYNLSGDGSLGSRSNDIEDNQSGIQKIGNNGWYRIWLTVTTTSTTPSGGMILSVLNGDIQSRLPSFNLTSNTESIFVWGAMRHLSNSLTSGPKPYQKTTDKINIGDGYITTWYDQSGNKNNAIQANKSAQPKIVDGVNGIIQANNKPVIQFDGYDDQLVNTSLNNFTPSTAFFIARRVSNNQSFMASLNNYAILGLGYTDLFDDYYLNKLNTVATTGGDTKNSLNLYTAIRTSGISSDLAIGAGSTSSNFLNGNMAELIIYNGNKLESRIPIENNIMDYYGTGTP